MAVTTHLEDRLLQKSWDDGLLDLFSGIGLLLIGIAWQFDIVPLGTIAPALLVPLWKPVRQRLIEPRAGYAEPGARTRQRMTQGMTMLLGVGVLSLLLGILLFTFVRGGGEVSASYLVPGLPAILLGVGVALAGQTFAVPRLFAYAALLAVVGLTTVALELPPAPSMLAGGFIMTVAGALLLARFLRENPIIDEDGVS
jgi:hypothetical protein